MIIFTSDTSMMTFTFGSKIVFISFATSIFKLETSSKGWVEMPSWYNGHTTTGILWLVASFSHKIFIAISGVNWQFIFIVRSNISSPSHEGYQGRQRNCQGHEAQTNSTALPKPRFLGGMDDP